MSRYHVSGACVLYSQGAGMQVNESQQALTDSDLDKLKLSLSSFLTKQQGLASSRSTPDAQSQHSGVPQAPAAAAPANRARDKTAGPAKMGKGSTEPAIPLLQTVTGQMTELSKWSSMLQTNAGVTLQDDELADWLAGLLRLHAGC